MSGPNIRARHAGRIIARGPSFAPNRSAAWSSVAACGAVLIGCVSYDYQLGSTPLEDASSPAAREDRDSRTPRDRESDERDVRGDLVGWASLPGCGPNGTTGGSSGPTVRVQTAAELDEAIRASDPSTIVVSGTIDLAGTRLNIPSDKTLLGVNAAEILGSVRIDKAHNVILKNIKFNGASASGDAVEVTKSTCVWLDHCEFVDGADGNLDIVRGSDFITVSWSRLYYQERTDSHRLGSLCKYDADSPGTLNVTFHHNWWGAGLLEMMPRSTGGQLHIFNNYYSASGNVYCIGAGYMSKLLVQNNYFDGVNDPIIFRSDGETAEILQTGNDYTNAVGERVSRGKAFDPPYSYTLEPAQAARDNVKASSGVQ